MICQHVLVQLRLGSGVVTRCERRPNCLTAQAARPRFASGFFVARSDLGCAAFTCGARGSGRGDLSPPVLHDIGLVAALDWLVDDMREKYGLEIVMENDHDLYLLDDRFRIILFRAVRELLINIAKHARAKDADIMIQQENGSLHVRVSDRGAGFDPQLIDRSSERRGFGLFSLRERLGQLGGQAEFESAPGQGTTVSLTVPLPPSRTS